MTPSGTFSRRNVLGMALGGAGTLMMPSIAKANIKNAYGLKMTNGNTQETFHHTLIADGKWIPEAVAQFDWFARDWRENAQYPMNVDSLLSMIKIQRFLESSQPMVLLSGYRTARTNGNLRGAAKHSLHMRGLAADITQPGRSIKDVRRAAIALRAGGVGYYPGRNFVHIDTGRVRHWTG